MMTPPYALTPRVPTLEEYRQLCEAVGWGELINFAVARVALAHSVAGVVVHHERETVGMGRIVGDGAIYFYLQDIAVLPAHQGRGVGRRILAHLMDYLSAHAPAQAFIGVFAAQGTQDFYRRYGFDTYPALTGMFQVAPVPSYESGTA